MGPNCHIWEAARATTAAPTFFKVADTAQLSKRQKEERIEPLYNKFEEKGDWRISKQKALKRAVNSTFV